MSAITKTDNNMYEFIFGFFFELLLHRRNNYKDYTK